MGKNQENMHKTDTNDSQSSVVVDKPAKNIKVNKDTKIFMCDLCPKSYRSRNGLVTHMESIHIRLRYDCKLCDRYYFRHWTLRAHEKTHYEKKYSCDVCEKRFHTIGNLKHHLSAVHLKIRESCNICGKMLAQGHLKKHINKTHLNIKPFSCEICKKEFQDKYQILQHMISIHLSESNKNHPESIRCRYCTKYFIKEVLDDHIKKEHKRLQCHFCSKIYFNKHSYCNHIKLHESLMFECDICKREFNQKGPLRTHMMTIHLKEKSKCHICNKILSKSGISTHIKFVHKKQKKISCDMCDMKFGKPNILRRHIARIHLKLSDHKCNICNKNFADNFFLKCHLKNVHSSKVQCKICSRLLNTERSYKRHLKFHKLKPFACPKLNCRKMFKLESDLISHIEVGKNFICHFCEDKFQNKGSIKDHLLKSKKCYNKRNL